MPSILQRIAHRGREVPRRYGFSRGLSVPVCCIAVALATPCLAVNSIDGWITTAPAEGDKANPACVTLSANITARIEPLKSLKLALAKTTPAPPKSISGAIDHLMGHDMIPWTAKRAASRPSSRKR